MALPVYRLRRWIATIAAIFIAVVAGMYYYARSRERSVLKQVPGKIGLNIKQTATGFQFSKSEGGRTLFTIQASHVTEFKLNGNAELRNVSIVLYGKDSSRFDQISGDDFSYNEKTGDIMAKGDVAIDLEANPAGQTSPDQAAPKELKNPIHLETRDLTFNRDSGIARTDARVEFHTAQATGWALGVRYNGRNNNLTLPSRVHIDFSGERPGTLEAASAVVTSDPRIIVMQDPVLRQPSGTMRSREATLFLGPTNNIERVLAKGDVQADTREAPASKNRGKASSASSASIGDQSTEIHARSDEGELLLTGQQSQVQSAIMTGNVSVDRMGSDMMQGTAGRVVLSFSANDQLDKIRAEQGAHLMQRTLASAKPSGTAAQDVDIEAPVIDFFMDGGNGLDRAVTSGAAQITIRPAAGASLADSNQPTSTQRLNEKTVITAEKFEAQFEPQADGKSRLASVHGEPNAKVVNTNSGEPDRISTSQMIDATFLPQGGIGSVVQQGHLAYTDTDTFDKRTQAWADRARFTPSDGMLTLTGNPRVVTGAMETTARIIRINRGTGDAIADGDVKSTYSELKEQPQGALLASSSPIHVTSASMTAHKSPADATYTGNTRLWQDANVIEAPSILFDRDRRYVHARGNASQPVSTVIVQSSGSQNGTPTGSQTQPLPKQKSQSANKGVVDSKQSPITITGMQLTYIDAERKAHCEGGVTAKGASFTETSKTLDAYLAPREGAQQQGKANQPLTGPARLDHMVAEGSVLVQQPNRRAVGQKLVYTAADDKFVLTGGPPSIFDAEQGKITGVSLTFFRSDDRVLVEGEASTPVVTQTRVAR